MVIHRLKGETLKILQIAPYFTPYPGGQERYVHNLSRQLVRLGHDVTVITSNYPKGSKFEVIDGFEIIRTNILFRPFRNPVSPFQIIKARKKDDYDIFHVHNHYSTQALFSSYHSLISNKPLVLTCHGQLIFNQPVPDKIIEIYNSSISPKIFDLADKICVPSNFDKETIIKINPNIENKISIIPNGIDPIILENRLKNTSKSQYRGKYPTNEKKILYVGRLVKRKGLDWLLESFSLLVNKMKFTNLILLVVGEGEDEVLFKRMVRDLSIENNVVFLGRITDNDLIYFYKNSDLLILPSFSEGCPTVILEAMFFGIPVISSNIPPIQEHFKNTAILVRPNDKETLAESIIELISNDDLTHQLIKKSYSIVITKYNWEEIAKEYIRIYKELI